jgi:hypothetical protein
MFRTIPDTQLGAQFVLDFITNILSHDCKHILSAKLMKRQCWFFLQNCLSIASFTQQGKMPMKAFSRIPYVVEYTVIPTVGKISLRILDA